MTDKSLEPKKQVSMRLTEKEFNEFKKLCHLEFSGMAHIARELVLGWMEKQRKKHK